MIKKIPSFIDLHVHFRDPGFNQKETILTGLKSAYFGGFGAVCTMPNTNPVCDNPKIAEYMINKANSTGIEVELHPVSAITKNLDSDILVNFDEMKNAGAIAFSNDGLPVLNKDVLIKALKTGEIIMSHLENETAEAKWQIEILDEVTNMAKRGECNFPRLHFCHISKKETIELIKLAKQKGLNLTAETAPHYFTFTKENLDNTGKFKMNPPLGSKEDKDAVIKAVIEGTIDQKFLNGSRTKKEVIGWNKRSDNIWTFNCYNRNGYENETYSELVDGSFIFDWINRCLFDERGWNLYHFLLRGIFFLIHWIFYWSYWRSGRKIDWNYGRVDS